MNFKVVLLIFVFISVSAVAQNIDELAVVRDGVTKYVPVYDREGTVYAAAIG